MPCVDAGQEEESMGQEEDALLGAERIAAARQDVTEVVARSLVDAIEETDKALIKASAISGEWAMDLRRQRQQLVDALCGMSGSPCKVNP